MHLVRSLFVHIAIAGALVAPACVDESQPETSSNALSIELEALTNDPDFESVLQRVALAAKNTSKAIYEASREEREELREHLIILRTDLVDVDPSITFEIPSVFTWATGLTDNGYKQLQIDMEVLALRYPKANVSPAFFGESAESMAIKMEYNFHSIEPCDTEECDCLDECADEYRNATNKAGLKWVAATWGGSFIGSVIGYIEMMDDYNDAYDALSDCRELCTGNSDGSCRDDSDCESCDFCGHAFGNPYWHCKTKRTLGKVCSRDGKCKSGCCKYHVWTNPFSMVCRPADKCN